MLAPQSALCRLLMTQEAKGLPVSTPGDNFLWGMLKKNLLLPIAASVLATPGWPHSVFFLSECSQHTPSWPPRLHVLLSLRSHVLGLARHLAWFPVLVGAQLDQVLRRTLPGSAPSEDSLTSCWGCGHSWATYSWQFQLALPER